MNLFVCVEDECTYYLCLILGYELFVVKDEGTYYLRGYTLGYEPFCHGR